MIIIIDIKIVSPGIGYTVSTGFFTLKGHSIKYDWTTINYWQEISYNAFQF